MRKPKKGQSLAEKYPELAAQWHPTKNGELTASDFFPASNKKVWWKCDKSDDHEWSSVIASRLGGLPCPVCSNKIVVASNCLATTHPELAKEWHPTKNGDLTPYDIVSGAGKKIWWKCDKGDDHEWKAAMYTRSTNNYGCPVCSGHKIVLSNCLSTTHPELVKEWHPTKNGKLTPLDFSSGSVKKIWWKCNKGEDHEWETPISKRTMGRNCTICSNQKIVLSNCIATTHPEICTQWHPTKNGKLTPYNISFGTSRNIWWKCDKGDDHEWLTVPRSLISGTGCPICTNKKVVSSNCLAKTDPKLASQWHPTKNGELTPFDVTSGSNKNIWWKCDKGDDHEWCVKPNSRITFNSKCPFCTLTPQSKQELTITFELLTLFTSINPRGFKTRVKGKLWTIDIFIPPLNLGVEFDGSYWHKDKVALDKLKTKKLKSEGFNILRVREEPLKKISDSDIISKQPFNAKDVTNNILTHIMNSFELEDVLVKKIKAYISKKKLQNEKGLDEYIEMILTEKAGKD